MDNVNHTGVIVGAEFMLVIALGGLAAACVVEWLRTWRHDAQGRVFFTTLTCIAVLLVLGLLANALSNMGVF